VVQIGSTHLLQHATNDHVSLFRWTGALGILATGVYLAKTLLPLPDAAHLACVLSFGPLVVAGSPGLARFAQANRHRAYIDVAKIFAIIAGTFHIAMVSVQLTTIHFMREDIREAATDTAKAALREILSGVFTVQLGLCFVWDLFIGLATILFSIALLSYGIVGRIIAVLGLLIAAAFLSFKLYTFPVPPADAGLFDLGPGMGSWFLAFSIFVLVTARRYGQGAGRDATSIVVTSS
jgi:hypothetical protein